MIASALGVLVGISGLDHGFFETLQGNTPTPGLIVSAIGPLQRMWVALFALALEIAIWGFVPGVSNPDHARMVCWSALAVMLAVLLVAIVAGFAHDIERQAGRIPRGNSR